PSQRVVRPASEESQPGVHGSDGRELPQGHDAIKPTRTVFSIEMMGWNLPDGPDSYLKLIRAVDRKQFGVHMDVCNGVNSPTRFYQNSAFISECFQKLGRWIASCHAKDLAWIPEMNVHFVEVIPGRGEIDYKT